MPCIRWIFGAQGLVSHRASASDFHYSSAQHYFHNLPCMARCISVGVDKPRDQYFPAPCSEKLRPLGPDSNSSTVLSQIPEQPFSEVTLLISSMVGLLSRLPFI